jgi:hypothetical protein
LASAMVEYLLDGKTLRSNRGVSAGHSDPLFFSKKNNAQKIKGTLGITGLPLIRVRIYSRIWHLDVGLFYPGAENGSKGLAVR